MGNGIVVAGNIVADTVKRIDNYPQIGLLCSIDSIDHIPGGPVPNMAIALKRMDVQADVRAVGLVGNDENGEFLTQAMAGLGVDVSGVQIHPTSFTAFTDVMTVRKTGERTFFHARGANSLFAPEHIRFDSYSGCTHFHLAYALLLDYMDGPDAQYGTVMARVLAEAQRHSLITSMDVVSESGDRFAEVVTPSLRYCDYLIVNEIEASRICGIPARDNGGALLKENIPRILRALTDRGVRRMAVVHAPEGGWGLTRGGDTIFRPSLRLPPGWIKGSVGAGDAFCAGVLYALSRELCTEDALDIGAAAAACVLGGSGADSVKPLCEIKEMIARMA